MTAVNLASGVLYTKGLPARDKVQIYGVAAVFLVLLYNSPSGLVLYWTLNNVFSLAKNCVKKIKLSGKILWYLIFVLTVLFDIYVIFIHNGVFFKRFLAASAITIFLLAVIFINSVKKFCGKIIQTVNSRNTVHVSTRIFLCAAAALFLLSGLVIPSALIASSTEEFSFIEPYSSPFPFIVAVMLQEAGFFLFWFPVVYFFVSRNAKNTLALCLCVLSAAALINTFGFPGNYGYLSLTLFFSDMRGFDFHAGHVIFNLLAIVCAAALCVILALSKRKTIFCSIQIIIIISLTAAGAFNLIKIENVFSGIVSIKSAAAPEKNNLSKPIYYFSAAGKNVIVIMLDRGISGYVPYIFAEKPELRESFSGFTWYPNCVSLGGGTELGLPPLFGGYEYSPDKVQTKGRRLVETWNESQLVLPRLFSENGFYVTVTDPDYINFRLPSDLSIYDDYANVHAENLHNLFDGRWLKNHPDIKIINLSKLLKNNISRFSNFKMSPLLFRGILYDGGEWMVNEKITEENNDLTWDTIDNYSILEALPEITRIDDADINTYTAVINDLTHEPAFFQAPDYTPSNNITNKGASPFANEIHYHANMAALVLLGKWFDYLKEHDAYDNTRIIISADHGWPLDTKLPDNFILPNDVMLIAVNPLLLVKDFKNDGDENSAEIKIDYTFMSHADVPYLASRDITDALNPFTRKPFFYDKSGGITVSTHYKWEYLDTKKYKWNINSHEWLRVHDNIFDPSNWEKAEK
jgi:hypothetical protein